MQDVKVLSRLLMVHYKMKKVKQSWYTICAALLAILFFCMPLFSFIKSVSAEEILPKYPIISKTTTKISAPATVVKEMKTVADLQKVREEGVQIAIIEFDKDLKAVLDGDSSKTINDAYELIKGKAIPAFKIINAECGTALTAYFNGVSASKKISDLFFIASDDAVLKACKDSYVVARGILDYTGKTFDTYFDVSGKAMSAYASIAIIDENKMTSEAVEYFQAAYMSIWTRSALATEFDTAKLLATGVNGVVTASPAKLTAVMNKINDVNTLVRRPMVVGHRGASLEDVGDPTTSMGLPENSMAAFKFAYENSADLIEIDVMLSSDNEIMVFHDDTLNRTLRVPASDGTIALANATKAKIQSYPFANCNAEYVNERVSTLDDVLNEFKGKDVRILIELKSNQTNLAEEVAKAVKAISMQSQVSFLSFYKGQLASIKAALPETVGGFLTFTALAQANGTIDVAENISLINNMTEGGKYAYSANTGLYNASLFAQETVRGIGFNGWTYVNAKVRNDHFGYGVQSLTVDVPQWFNSKIKSVSAKETANAYVGEVIDFELTLKTFKDVELEVNTDLIKPVIISGDAVAIEDGKLVSRKVGESVVVPRYQQSGYTIMGNPVVVTVTEQPAEVPVAVPGCNCNSSVLAAMVFSTLAIVTIGLLFRFNGKF